MTGGDNYDQPKWTTGEGDLPIPAAFCGTHLYIQIFRNIFWVVVGDNNQILIRAGHTQVNPDATLEQVQEQVF